jgi:hypothetical protein
MARRPFAFLRGRAALAALCGSLAVVVLTGSMGSERLVQSGFDRALLKLDSAPQGATLPALAQSEEFWLRNSPHRSTDIKPAAWSGELARGDRLTMAGANGARVFEVIETSRVSPEATRLDAGPEGGQLIAVTCREVGRADAAPVRLIITEGSQLPFRIMRAGEKSVL